MVHDCRTGLCSISAPGLYAQLSTLSTDFSTKRYPAWRACLLDFDSFFPAKEILSQASPCVFRGGLFFVYRDAYSASLDIYSAYCILLCKYGKGFNAQLFFLYKGRRRPSSFVDRTEKPPPERGWDTTPLTDRVLHRFPAAGPCCGRSDFCPGASSRKLPNRRSRVRRHGSACLGVFIVSDLPAPFLSG